jgi:predicted Zn-dependent protease
MKLKFGANFNVFSLLLFAFFLSGCSGLPVTDVEVADLGTTVHEIAIGQYGEYRDLKIREYVEAVGRRVEAASDYTGEPIEYVVLDTPDVNSFSIPGKYIHVTRGLLARTNSEAELAFVLGHELGHLSARHAAQILGERRSTGLLSASLGLLVAVSAQSVSMGELAYYTVNYSAFLGLLDYGGEREFEADSLGMKYALNASYDPRSAVKMLKTLEDLESEGGGESSIDDYLATHPPTESRVERAEGLVKALISAEAEGETLYVGRDELLYKINEIVLGDSFESGELRGSVYRSGKYMFSVKKLRGWDFVSSRKYPAGLVKDSYNFILISAGKPATGEALEDFATEILRELLRNEIYRPAFDEIEFLGEPALGHEHIDWAANTANKARFLEKNGIYYFFIYTHKENPFMDFKKQFEEILEGFSFLTAEEVENISEDKLELYAAEPGDTFAGLSKKFYYKEDYADRLMIFNGLEGDPEKGAMLKIAPVEYIK